MVVLRCKIFVYTMSPTPERIFTLETADNEDGICCLSPDLSLLAFPARQEGFIQIVDLLGDGTIKGHIRAHKSKIACLAFNSDGSKLASASIKGTLIRVFDVANGRVEGELRRGSDRALIYSIAFSHDSKRLVVSSDKGTVHIFRLDDGTQILEEGAEEEDEDRPEPLKYVKDLLPKYFASKRSFAHFKVKESPCIVAFGAEKNTVVIVSTDGSYYKYSFDLVRGGDAVRQAYNKYLQIGDLH